MNASRIIPRCLVVLLLAILVLPASGQAKVAFGIQGERQADTTLSRDQVMRMREGGAKVLRTPLEWELVQRDSANADYDFSNFDRLVEWSTEGSLPKIQILPILIGTPGWVKGAKSNNEPPTTKSDLNKWKQFVTAAVKRYGANGPIKAFQVWNEPNLKTFWTNGKPNAGDYADFLELSGKAIRRGDPRAKVIVAGMPERSNAPSPMRDYLKKLYRVKGFNRLYDALAVHPFASNEKGVLNGIERIRALMKKNGDKRTPLWVTEVGYASAGPKTPFTKSASGQAKALKDTLGAIRRKSDKLGVPKAIWFSWRDSDTSPPKNPANNRWQSYTGLFTFGGDPKPSWGAFAQLAGGSAGGSAQVSGKVDPSPPAPAFLLR